MDLYQKTPTTIRKLLAKRQNPSTQIFKSQPSTLTSEPMTTMNLQQKAIPSPSNNSTPQVLSNSQATVIIMTPNANSSISPSPMLEEQQPVFYEDGDSP